ncbi:hypothetical protein HELRODRAFT_169281 [Helobdella robusta]|uniref:Uncharacterized protein n=1 Tax=Helobdella robusta TaxID=6412 RepID=T1F1Q0_HELRO|nr:hypothetical protein HELRODRAFT_169281 [Helobdella robusta]ESO08438.1 hypothetical protein HELRODRAFT_169281 [Helobdella robusta]
MWLVAKNSSLLLPDLTLIILHIALRNLRVLGSIGPKTSIHIGKTSIEGRAFPYFFIFSSAVLAAAKPHSLLVSHDFSSVEQKCTNQLPSAVGNIPHLRLSNETMKSGSQDGVVKKKKFLKLF